MAETQTLAEMYGMGGQQYPGPDEIYTTADVNARMHQGNPVSNALRGLAGHIPTNQDHGLSALNMIRGGLNSAANWLDRRPEVGPDTLAPLGLAAVPSAAMMRRLPSPERPRLTPAISVDGSIYARGPTHSQALDEWAMRRGRELSDADIDAIYDTGRMTMGYTTADGTFLNRQEAQRHLGLPETGYGLESRDGRRKGVDIRADSSRASLPGIVVNGLEQGQLPRISNPIRAYHGSPHDFNEFSLSKIGTGEGAQAYGHGLYFAENEGVARYYKRHEMGKGEKTVNGQPFDYTNPSHLAADYIDAWGPEALSQIKRDLATRNDHTRARHERAAQMIEADPASIPSVNGPAKMYEVNLHATPEQFLDWDKPLSQQGEAVRAALEARDRRILEDYRPIEVPGWGVGEPAILTKGDPSGSRIYGALSGLHEKDSGLFGHRGNQDRATAALQEAGIPGIRYLDQLSRPENIAQRIAAQERHVNYLKANGDPKGTLAEQQAHLDRLRSEDFGTRNYVVWTPEIIEILRKYGLAGAAALPPAVQGAFSDHDPLNPWRQ